MGNNVLYIEDNPDNMMLVKRALEARGYRLLQAPNGLKGVEVAENQDVDLVLLDINLPDIDGYEVARQLRADERFRAVPLIAITGFGGDADRARAASAGFCGYLVKPVPYDLLTETLAQLDAGAERAAALN